MQSAKQLLGNEEVMTKVRAFFGNKQFYDQCIARVRDIVADGRIDSTDIPNIVLLVTTILNTKPQLKVNTKNMKPIVKMLVVQLLKEVKFIDPENGKDLPSKYEVLIDSALQLLATNVHLGNIIQTIKDKICGCLKKEQKEANDHLDNIKEQHNQRKKINSAIASSKNGLQNINIDVDN
jgi:hypothetical protein